MKRNQLLSITMLILLLAGLLLFSHVAHAELVTVVRVIDGDTVWVHSQTDPTAADRKVRLRYVDAPESCQPYGAEATAYTTKLVLNKTVEFTKTGVSYDRYVGNLTVNGSDVATALVTNGMAWVYKRGVRKSSSLRPLEARARANRTGLWSTAAVPVEPWIFRKTHRCPHPKVKTNAVLQPT